MFAVAVASLRMTAMRYTHSFLSRLINSHIPDRLMPKYFEYAEIFNYHYLMLLAFPYVSLPNTQFGISLFFRISESSHKFIELQIEY